ncbi:MAG TPA: hypothetical protein VIH03_08740 [Nitrososphaerales archaeon]
MILLLASSMVTPFAQVYAQEDNRAKASAAEIISKAETAVKDAIENTRKAKDIAADVEKAESLLTQAQKYLEEAKAANSKSNYEAATKSANLAIENAGSAKRLAVEAYNRVIELRTKVEQQIASVSRALSDVTAAVAEAEKKGFNVSRVTLMLREASEILAKSKTFFEYKKYGDALELANSALELIGKVKLAISLLTIDHIQAERIFVQIHERIEKLRSFLADARKNNVNVEKLQISFDEAVKMIALLEVAYKNKDNATFSSLSVKILELITNIEANTRPITAIGVAPVDRAKMEERARFEELIAKIRRMIEEAKKILIPSRVSNVEASDASKQISELTAMVERANVAYKEGNTEKAYAMAKEAYANAEKLLHRGEKLPDRAEAAAKELRMAYEKIQNAEKILVEVRNAKINVSGVQNVLREAHALLTKGYEALKNGNATLAYSIAKDVEALVDKALAEFRESLGRQERNAQVNDGQVREAIQKAKTAMEQTQQKIERAETAGINMVPILNIFEAGDDTIAKAEEFLTSGQVEAANALAKVAEKLFNDAARLIDILMESAKNTEIARKEVKKIEKVRVEKKEDSVNVTSENRNIRLNLQIPRIVYSVKQGEKSVDFQSRVYALTEFNDKNRDNVVQEEEILQRLNFADMKWAAEQTVEGSVIIVTYRAQSERYDISIIFKIYEESRVEFFRNDERTVVYSVEGGAREAKFDLIVNKWPWMMDSSSLALRVKTQADAKGEVNVEKVSADEQRIVIDSQGILVKIKWVPRALIQEADGVQRIMDIGFSHRLHRDLKELDADFVYPNFKNRVLIHDPSVGVAEPSDVTLAPAQVQQDAPVVQAPAQTPAKDQVAKPDIESNTLSVIGAVAIIMVIVGATIAIRRRKQDIKLTLFNY